MEVGCATAGAATTRNSTRQTDTTQGLFISPRPPPTSVVCPAHTFGAPTVRLEGLSWPSLTFPNSCPQVPLITLRTRQHANHHELSQVGHWRRAQLDRCVVPIHHWRTYPRYRGWKLHLGGSRGCEKGSFRTTSNNTTPCLSLTLEQDDGTPVTLFIFDSTLGPFQPGNKDRKTLLQIAKNSLKKLRTIRHPDV